MEFLIEITEPAEADTEEAYLWYYREDHKTADTWFRGLQRAFFSLRELPERCVVAPEGERVGRKIQQLLYGKGRHMYRILFETRDDAVCILRVRHTSRPFLALKDFRQQ